MGRQCAGDPSGLDIERRALLFLFVGRQAFERTVRPAHRRYPDVEPHPPKLPDFAQDERMIYGGILAHQIRDLDWCAQDQEDSKSARRALRTALLHSKAAPPGASPRRTSGSRPATD